MASNGNKGRFSERLKKIAFRKRNRVNYGEDKNVKIKYNNVLKVLAAIPGMVYTNLSSESVVSKERKKEKKEEKQVVITATLVDKDKADKNILDKKEDERVYRNSRKEDLEQKPFLRNEINEELEQKPFLHNEINEVKVNKKIDEINFNSNMVIEKEKMVDDSLSINDKNILEKEKVDIESLIDNNIVDDAEVVNDESLVVNNIGSGSNLDDLNSFNNDNTEDEKQILSKGNISEEIKRKDNDGEIPKKAFSFFDYNDDKKKEDNDFVNDSDDYHKTGVDILPVISKNDINSYSKDISDGKELLKNIDNQQEKNLAKDILNSIKKKLVLSINNLEIMQSELYILSEVNGDNKKVEECNRQIKEIKELLKKIEKLKKKYDYLKDNYDFEYLMDLDDDNLVQKITELRDNYGKKNAKDLVDEYKLLDEYKFLYSKVDKIEDKTKEIENNKNKELEKLKERDIDFEELKSKLYNVSNVNSSYNQFIKDQNQIVKELNESVAKINSYEKVTYHFEGFNKLLLNSFKYLGLLALKPLRGSIPAIATETLITYGVVKNLYKNLSLKEDRRVVYEAIDYENTINDIIGNMDLTGNLINNSLRTIAKLKLEYADKFSKYENDFPEYETVVHKINDIESKIMANKIKVEIIKKQAMEQKKANDKKLILVDKLNNSDKNN